MCQCIGTPECQCDVCPNSGDVSRGWRLSVFCDNDEASVHHPLDERTFDDRSSERDSQSVSRLCCGGNWSY